MAFIWVLFVMIEDEDMSIKSHIVGAYDSEEQVRAAKQDIISRYLKSYSIHGDSFWTKRGYIVDFSVVKTCLNSTLLSDKVMSIFSI